jgi:predicted DNA binding CopG/RHH family protein
MKYYNKDEQKLIETIEKEDWTEVDNMVEAIEEAKRIAQATTTKSERMNIRMSEKDMKALKARAIEEGLPYQSLVSSVLHKYVNGQLVEKQTSRE